jgi:hypothetical protein
MEYANVYDVLYKTLYNIFPTVIIKNLIFRYTVEPNEYIRKYIKAYDYCYKSYINKQFNIICCESGTSYILLDAGNGRIHDGLCIDVNTINKRSMMRYFKHNVIILTYSDCLCKYVLNNTQYELTHTIHIDTPHIMCVYNNCIYRFENFNGKQYQISIYDLSDLKKIKYSVRSCDDVIFDCSPQISVHDCSPQISVHDDIIYIYDGYKHIYIHDIELNYIKTHTIPCNIFNILIHKNKLYKYKTGTIFVYDMLTSELIHSFETNCYDHVLFISDDLLTLHNNRQIVFYDIK